MLSDAAPKSAEQTWSPTSAHLNTTLEPTPYENSESARQLKCKAKTIKKMPIHNINNPAKQQRRKTQSTRKVEPKPQKRYSAPSRVDDIQYETLCEVTTTCISKRSTWRGKEVHSEDPPSDDAKRSSV